MPDAKRLSIRFNFAGTSYRVPYKVYEQDIPIVLPGGKTIKVLNWSETHPPKPLKCITVNAGRGPTIRARRV